MNVERAKVIADAVIAAIEAKQLNVGGADHKEVGKELGEAMKAAYEALWTDEAK